MTQHRVLSPEARKLKAIADETRIRILAELGGRERCVCELMETLDIPQPLLSFHLKVLKEAELVKDRREGRWCHYTLCRETLLALSDSVAGLAVSSGPPRRGRRCA